MSVEDCANAQNWGRIMRSKCNNNARSGKVLAIMAIVLPTIVALLGLTFDSSLLLQNYREQQQIADAAATLAARRIADGDSLAEARAAAIGHVQQTNGWADAAVTVNRGPTSGSFAGDSDFVEVILTRDAPTYFIKAVSLAETVETRAVAGIRESTADTAVVVLEEDPAGIRLTGLPISLSLPSTNLGGFENIGLGQLSVNGAVIVNTEWGGFDENNDPVGCPGFLRHAATCTPLLPLSKVKAHDVRVTGGVDNPSNYGAYDGGDSGVLRANRRPVKDPLRDLPVPTVGVDATNVSSVNRGGVSVINLPILAPAVRLRPGVYDYIHVITGPVIFEPGVYIIRGKHPLTQISLNITAGPVRAEGVMFYITDSPAYSVSTGAPDSADGESQPADYSLETLLPSVVIDAAILGSHYTPLSSPGSPFDGMLIYQRRQDRRPIVIVAEQLLGGLLGSTTLAGRIYSKWAPLVFVANGEFDLSMCVGSLRLVNVLDCTLDPSNPFPPASDVYLVE